MSQKKTDFYEFYWANLISEPKLGDLYSWVFRLLFVKKPFKRVEVLLWTIRIIMLAVLITFGFIIANDFKHFQEQGIPFFKLRNFCSCILHCSEIINSKAAQTVGDAVKYLTPFSQNIESRYKIRKKGIQLLKKLHDNKDEDGNPQYERIVIVGHSLGSVVAYELITNLWHDYMYEYHPEEFPVVQTKFTVLFAHQLLVKTTATFYRRNFKEFFFNSNCIYFE